MERPLLWVSDKLDVVAPKLGILASMLQVQRAVIPAFDIEFPEQYSEVLSDVSIWELRLPLDCIIFNDYYSRLFYSTLIPLGIALFFGMVAVLSRRAHQHPFP